MRDRTYSITLQKLRVFAAVARELSFVRAADALLLSLPTVSEEIKSLESAVGLKLMHRSRGRATVELTEAGLVLLASYREISGSLAKANEALDAIRKLERGTVSFGTDVIFGGYLLASLHDTFCRDHPGIAVHVEIAIPSHILDGMKRGQIEVAVLLGPIEQEGLSQEPLAPCYMVPVGPPGHRLSRGWPAPFGELAKERWLLPGRYSLMRTALDRMAAQNGIELNVALEVANIDTNMQAVIRGLGVTVLSTHCIAAEVAAGRLSVLQIEGFPMRFQWFVIHPDLRLTPSCQALKTHLLASKGLLKPQPLLPARPKLVSA